MLGTTQAAQPGKAAHRCPGSHLQLAGRLHGAFVFVKAEEGGVPGQAAVLHKLASGSLLQAQGMEATRLAQWRHALRLRHSGVHVVCPSVLGASSLGPRACLPAWNHHSGSLRIHLHPVSSRMPSPPPHLVLHHVGVVQVQHPARQHPVPQRHQPVVRPHMGRNVCGGGGRRQRKRAQDQGEGKTLKHGIPSLQNTMLVRFAVTAKLLPRHQLGGARRRLVWPAPHKLTEGPLPFVRAIHSPHPGCRCRPLPSLTCEVEAPGHFVREEALLEGRQRCICRVPHRMHQARIGHHQRNVAHQPRIAERLVHQPAGGAGLGRDLAPHASQVGAAEAVQLCACHGAVALCGVKSRGRQGWPHWRLCCAGNVMTAQNNLEQECGGAGQGRAGLGVGVAECLSACRAVRAALTDEGLQFACHRAQAAVLPGPVHLGVTAGQVGGEGAAGG